MGQQANITVFDGAATPVTHTLVGEGVVRAADGSITATWKESTSLTIPDYAQIRIKTTKRKLPTGINRMSVRCEVPIMEAVGAQNSSGYTAPPKVAHTVTLEAVSYFHERSTTNDRRLVRQMLINLLGNVSTSVTPVAVGPAPELIDQLIQVT